MRRLVLRLWDDWFGREVAEVEATAERFRTSPAGKGPDWKAVWVLVVGAVALTGQNFWHVYVPVVEIGKQLGLPWDLSSLLGFALGCVFWYCVPAVLLIKFAFRERVTDYGVKLRGWSSGWKIYVVFVAVMVPLVLVFSTVPEFQRIYPFYRTWTPEGDGWGRLLAWEVAYAFQFVALEFFFRGFLLQCLRRVMGANAIFVMMIPYCMIHYGKPMAETFGAIGAGLVLGTLAMRTRSIWGGVMIHVGVAISMDVLALRGCPPMGSDSYCHP